MGAPGSHSAADAFGQLVEIMARLRSPDGCPWDRDQTFDSLKPYLLEEAYEVLDAIDARDWPGLADELGDLMLQPVFLAQMAAEAGHFTIADSVQAIVDKLIRRHPHVFQNAQADTPEDVKRRWDEIKREEKAERGGEPALLLDSISRAQPALAEAQQVATKAARAGFDWQNAEEVLDKLDEELSELARARTSQSSAEIEDEVGDILFVIVNLARFLNVDSEQALRKATAKFRRRFTVVEEGLRAEGKTLEQGSMDEMERLWQQAKRSERP